MTVGLSVPANAAIVRRKYSYTRTGSILQASRSLGGNALHSNSFSGSLQWLTDTNDLGQYRDDACRGLISMGTEEESFNMDIFSPSRRQWPLAVLPCSHEKELLRSDISLVGHVHATVIDRPCGMLHWLQQSSFQTDQ